MKILYVFPEEFSGRFAREYHVYRLAESLAGAGCDVTLAAAPSERITSADDLKRAFGGSGTHRLRLEWLSRQMKLGPLKIRSGAWFYRQLDALVATEKFDATFTMHVKAADHLARKHSALPLIFEAHEIFADSYANGTTRHEKLLATERSIYAHACGVVAISAYLGKCLHERFGLKVPLHVQHDGLGEKMLDVHEAEPNPHELIYTGSLQPWKGVPTAVEAMRLLPEFHLTVLGGEGDKLEALKRGAPDNITFLGTIPRDELGAHLQRATIGLMPNLLEPRSARYTFPLKLLEYSAAGKGIVASRIPAFEELDAAGWVELVPSGLPEAIALGVRALSQRNIDRAAARAWAGQFTWARQGAAMQQFFQSVLGASA